MSKFNKSIITAIVFAVLLSKSFIPTNGTSVILEGNKKEYIYYKFGKDGLVFNSIDNEFLSNDSIRIKLFIRSISSELDKNELFKVKIEMNTSGNSDSYIDGATKTLKYSKSKTNIFKIKNRPGWKVTKAGIWFMDVYVSDFKNIKISGDKKLIIKATIDQINRGKYSKVKSLSTINKETRYTIDTKKLDEKTKKTKKKSSYWYQLDGNTKELQFEAIGPTSIRVFTRLGHPSTNTEENNYTLFIKEDGLDIGTYFFKSEVSAISLVKNSGGKVGKWRTCWINVPKGKHYYTLKNGGLSDNPIYIKVKQYEK